MARLKVAVSARDHVQGPDDADVTLVEYGDFECPHCGHAYPIVKQVEDHFGDRLRFVYRHFPLREIHPHAEAAAETSEYAGAQDRFWEMHDLLFENQQALGLPLLVESAEALGLSSAGLRKALDNGDYAPKVQSDFLGGVRSGVNGTPTFFIEGERHDGPHELADLVSAIERRMKRVGVRR
ncbi:MAG: disulfide bond formation protein DsbA [Acidobacteria bacterium]|nr:MAG: disulfide bond formation protein DsbA [Acidobacteriota bacterium]